MLHSSAGFTPRLSTTFARRAAVALAVPVFLTSVAACDSGDSGDGKSTALPSVTGKPGEQPKVAKGKGDPPKGLKTKVLKQGKGKRVKKGDALNADYSGQLWNGKVFDSSWKRGQPATFEIGAHKVIPGWDQALVGQKLGSRVELVVPPDKGYGKRGQPPQIPGNSTLVFVVDLKKTMPSKIDGKPSDSAPDSRLPKVSTKIDKDKAPKITMPKGKDDAPDDLISDSIIKGDGKKVTDKSTVLAHFTAKLWKGGKQLDDTWKQGGPQEIPVSKIPGWKEGLKGKKAGSRVVMSVPKSKFPKQQRKQFGSGVVFSVDVLNVG